MWTLILMMHVGVMGSGNSNSLTNVSGFNSESSCVDAGKKAEKMARDTVKEIKFVCVQLK